MVILESFVIILSLNRVSQTTIYNLEIIVKADFKIICRLPSPMNYNYYLIGLVMALLNMKSSLLGI